MKQDELLQPLSYVIKQKLTRKFKYAFPCGQCFNCRINQSRIWKNRILLEAKSFKNSYFLTLTYDDQHLPYNENGQPILVKKHLQNYLKRIRKAHEPYKLRFYAVGEYGSTTWRPHFHLTLFSDFPIDKDMLNAKWSDTSGTPIGYTYCGDVANGSAAYIAGYIQKKATKQYFTELGDRPPEFATMSRHNGGIGTRAIKAIAEVYLDNEDADMDTVMDFISMGKKKMPIGRYLTQILSAAIGVDENAFVKRYYDVLYEQDMQFDMETDSFYADMLDYYKGKRDSNINRQELRKSQRRL